MVKIRLRRMGAKKRPFYRLVVSGQPVCSRWAIHRIIGYYDPTRIRRC